MSNAQPFILRWGIMATGRISGWFAKDILLDPNTRGVSDVHHVITAVGSSSSIEKSKEFIKTHVTPTGGMAAPYGNYEDLVKDQNVDVIYIGSAQSEHYPNALLALEAGKHVCCEKPFTINKEQTAHLIEVARSKKLFLMEAVWTRFFPITLEIQKLIHKDRILGPLRRVNADYGLAAPPTHRLRNAEVGGGALLDVGMYVILWVFLMLLQDPDNNLEKPLVHGTIIKDRKVDVDEFTTATLYFEKLHAVAVCSTTLAALTPQQHSIVIQGEKGDMYIHGPPSRPEAYTLHLKGSEPTRHEFSIPGLGMFWEADAIARDIRDGKTEDERCNLAESYALMEVMDEIRKQGGLRFPDRIEHVRK